MLGHSSTEGNDKVVVAGIQELKLPINEGVGGGRVAGTKGEQENVGPLGVSQVLWMPERAGTAVRSKGETPPASMPRLREGRRGKRQEHLLTDLHGISAGALGRGRKCPKNHFWLWGFADDRP